MAEQVAKAVFLDHTVLEQKEESLRRAVEVKQNKIRFEFPNGFTQLRLIEECRALNCLDVSDPDNFDFMYDITMQMLVGKPVFIYLLDAKGKWQLGDRFVVTDRYMNLRGVNLIDEYPVVVNWLVEFISGELSKKFPRSYEVVRTRMSERSEERTMMSQNPMEGVRTSS